MVKTIPIYKFYATAFNYNTEKSTRSRQFSIAVNVTLSLLLDSFLRQSISEIQKKAHHPLVKKFIENAIEIAYEEYKYPFDKLIPHKNNVILNKEYRIAFECILDPTAKKVIILNFGREEKLYQETSALVGLINEFQLSNPIPIGNFRQICYWCLSSGNKQCFNINEVTPFSRNKILEVLEAMAN